MPNNKNAENAIIKTEVSTEKKPTLCKELTTTLATIKVAKEIAVESVAETFRTSPIINDQGITINTVGRIVIGGIIGGAAGGAVAGIRGVIVGAITAAELIGNKDKLKNLKNRYQSKNAKTKEMLDIKAINEITSNNNQAITVNKPNLPQI